MTDALLMCGPDAIAETKACTLEFGGQVLGDDLAATVLRMDIAKSRTDNFRLNSGE